MKLENVISLLVILTLILHTVDFFQTEYYMGKYGWKWEVNPNINNLNDLHVAKGSVLLMLCVFVIINFVLRYFPSPLSWVLRVVLVISLAYPLLHIFWIVLKNFRNILFMGGYL